MVKNDYGFTLLELMAVVAVLAILSSIALSSYGKYRKKVSRTNMMSDLQLISSELEHLKQVKGSFRKVSSLDLSKYMGGYPKNTAALYTVSIASDDSNKKWTNPIETNWKITATPSNDGIMFDDGVLTLNYQGIKCHNKGSKNKCGSSDEWRYD